MEKRTLLAIVLSVSILVLWQALFSPPTSPPSGPGEPPRGTPPAGPPATPATPGEGAATLGRPQPAVPTGAGSGAVVKTPLFEAGFRADGTVDRWTLGYRGAKPLVVGGALSALAVAVGRGGGRVEGIELRPAVERLEVGRGQAPATLTFTGSTGDGVRLTRELRVTPDRFRVDVVLRVESAVPAGGPLGVTLYWTSPVAVYGASRDVPPLTFGEGPDRRQLLGRVLVERPGKPEAFEAPSATLKDPKEAPGPPQLKDPSVVRSEAPSDRRWVALENDYFIAALIPGPGGRVHRARDGELAEVGVAFGDVRAEPGTPWEGRVTLYVGPKEWERLSELGVGLEQAQARNYGDFLWTLPMEWFCVPLLWLMNFLALHLGQNYGVAIILLTVLVKIVFYPLTQKSMSSMKQMQTLQPQLNALKNKYKSEPQRFQREQMELFRKHRVNPMGGCLPMIVQIPIFYALYLTLQYSVELQGASFVWWITDLSKKDPYYVLPILMGVSMLVQQKMTPTVGDPRQAQIMLIMPVIFTFMFLEFPTGLVLYWFVNNVLSIGQQSLIERAARRQTERREAEARVEKGARRA